MFSCNSFAFNAKSTKVNIADILASSIADNSCHNYCITGACVSIKCSIFGCDLTTSVRVKHHNPDLVISVYDESGDNPFVEAGLIYDSIEENGLSLLIKSITNIGAGGNGHRTEGGNVYADQSLRYKEATAVGNPLATFSEIFSAADLFCPSEATPLVPYFSSSLDAITWRLGIPEYLYLANLLPGARVVGNGFTQQWGPVWPRTGFIVQKDDVKASAVVAQRVANIVTRSGQPHVYVGLNGNGYNRTWLPGEAKENSKSALWQMLAPKSDNQCYSFGRNDVFSTPWSQGRTSEDNSYAYSLWRPYECCRVKGSLLYTTNAVNICL
jgi:integrating conjugative element protein (TIGR03756 family)